jgi:alkylated DNA repair dioxygenase AlkB
MPRILDLPDADIGYLPDFLPARLADRLLAALRAEIRWSQHRVRLFGREHRSPRLSAWYGDPDAVYRYSGQTLRPVPWTASLEVLRERVQRFCHQPFDGVLLNLYRDGRDGMGWHSDDERELGAEPSIASVSLGAPRRFRLKHRTRPDVTARTLVLEHGSLLWMRGATQQHWRHSIPKTRTPVGERLNLTFRAIACRSKAASMGGEVRT